SWSDSRTSPTRRARHAGGPNSRAVHRPGSDERTRHTYSNGHFGSFPSKAGRRVFHSAEKCSSRHRGPCYRGGGGTRGRRSDVFDEGEALMVGALSQAEFDALLRVHARQSHLGPEAARTPLDLTGHSL